MKNVIFLVATLSLIFFCCKKESTDQCSPPPQWIEVILPDSVQFGETLVYLNGKKVDYAPIFVYQSFYNLMGYGFQQITGDIINTMGFDHLLLEKGDYGLYTIGQEAQPDKAFSAFGQIFDGDIIGYSYKLEESVEGFIHVEYLDSINQVVKGRFKVAFCRTSTNGYEDLGLPEHLLFQGVFNEKYEVR